MWVLFAIASSFFAGITAILAKCGIQKTDSDVATAIRTVVVFFFSWLLVFVTGAWAGITRISGKTLLFLVLSGLATGASWICYFHALQKGDVNKVVPIDKSSTVLTIFLAFVFLREGITAKKAIFAALIGVGTMLMVSKKEPGAGKGTGRGGRTMQELPENQHTSGSGGTKEGGWLVYAALSAVFASLTAILGKVGIAGIDSNLGTAIRTTVVLAMAWVMVFVAGKQGKVAGTGRVGKVEKIERIERTELGFVVLSGLATGASWLCYYRALQDGPASVVVPIDKLSILVTIGFSWIVFHERLTKKAVVGVALITVGTVLLAVG